MCSEPRRHGCLCPRPGQWRSYVLDAPEFVNQEFGAMFPDGLPALTPLVAKSEGATPPGDTN